MYIRCLTCNQQFPADFAKGRDAICYPCRQPRSSVRSFQLSCRSCKTLMWRTTARGQDGYCDRCCERRCALCKRPFYPRAGHGRFCSSCSDEVAIRRSAAGNAANRCPECSSDAIAPVVYGWDPLGKLRDRVRAGEIVLGGCRVGPENMGCAECDARWRSSDLPSEVDRFRSSW